jgi:hypothetical protein
MYNKLYTKILDSSIWLEPNPTRIVWITFLAAMDEDGFAQFSSVRNLANRAMVTAEEAEAAVLTLESQDSESASKDHDGRRIERVDGGWMVLNAGLYRDIVTRTEKLRLNRERVARYRAKQRACNAAGNAPVMQSYAGSEALSESGSDKAEGSAEGNGANAPRPPSKTRASRIPENWTPSPDLVAYAERELPGVDVEKLAEAFRDFWIAAAGERARKLNWAATWRTWVRRSARDYPTKRQPAPLGQIPGKRAPPTDEQIAVAHREAAEANRRELASKLGVLVRAIP